MRPSPPSLAILLALAAACGPPTANDPVPASPAAPSRATTDLEELHAFARLYGYVRYFHPSDEAAALDWDGFAVHGVQQVTAARTRDELAHTLEALFLPVAPTLHVHLDGEAPRDAAALFPADVTGLDVVAWQHEGYGFGDMITAYSSGRTHRQQEVPQGYERSSTVTQAVDAKPLRGQRIRLTAFARVDPSAPAASVRPSISIERTAGTPTREVGSLYMETRWAPIAVEALVPADAKEITLGLAVIGQGAAWLDDVVLEREDGEAWQPLPLDNPGFEADAARPRKWDTDSDSFAHEVSTKAHAGERALRVARKHVPATPVSFQAVPQPGELFSASLGAGLHCRLPLSLYSRGGHTLAPPGSEPPMLPDLSAVPRSPEHPAVRTAAVVVAWNVFQHFYPYFDVVDTDWPGLLDQALINVLDDASPQDTHRTLRWMVAQLHDGHGNVLSPIVDPNESILPVRLGWVEGQVVVLATVEGSPLQRGDVVLRIDGEDVMARLDAELALASGSLQWRRYRTLEWGSLTRGPSDAPARVELRRGSEALALDVPRGEAQVPPTWSHEPIAELPGGVWLIDLERAEWTAIYAKLDAIAKAPGVVFDARGYPNGTHPVLRHLMSAPEQNKWMFVPQIIYPDRERIAGWQEHGWDMAPAEPRITGKVAFITGGGAISYAESTMGYVEGLGLGEIVGGPTAGANGNVNPFTTPGGYTLYWTGMKVLKHDGSQHHTLGIQPTVPAEPTLAGIREGRDELLERALEVVRAK